MTKARRDIIDTDVTRYYHCISSCVRQGFHCEVYGDLRRLWLRTQIRRLAKEFSLDVCAFAFMASHFHVIVRLNPGLSEDWSDEEVIRRWARVCGPRDSSNRLIEVTEDWIQEQAVDKDRVEELRSRLDDLGWFMRLLKQPLARRANKEDGVWGHFWAGRYKSIPIVGDELELAQACVYVDLNPFAAQESELPEESCNCSIHHRLHAMRASEQQASTTEESTHEDANDNWLCPIETEQEGGILRTGMFERLRFEEYLALLEVTSRRIRKGKRMVNVRTDTVQDRWNLRFPDWSQTLERFMECFRDELLPPIHTDQDRGTKVKAN